MFDVGCLSFTAFQAAHGFVVGNVLRVDRRDHYVKAIADSLIDVRALGVVVQVTDVNRFTVAWMGIVTGLTGLIPGAIYYLSPTVAGAITTTRPATLRTRIGIAVSSTKLVVSIDLAEVVQDTNAFDAVNKQGSTIAPGFAVATHSSGTGVVLAQSNSLSKPAVGLMRSSTIANVAGTVQTEGMFSLADWTAVVGSATLTRGPYYLDPTTPGMLTSTAPTTAGQTVQVVGYAVSTLDLDLSIASPILL